MTRAPRRRLRVQTVHVDKAARGEEKIADEADLMLPQSFWSPLAIPPALAVARRSASPFRVYILWGWKVMPLDSCTART